MTGRSLGTYLDRAGRRDRLANINTQEHEFMMISQASRSAIASYQASGGVLGTTRPGGWRAAAQANRANADAAYVGITPMVLELRGEGLSLQAIANILNAEGLKTRRGMDWNSVQVGRVLARAGG